MSHPLFPVAVLMRKVPIVNRWATERWEAAAVHPAANTTEILCVPQSDDAWLWHGFTLDRHLSEAEGYYLNLSTADPCVFVMWRFEDFDGSVIARPRITTASYSEAARMMDVGESVDSVAMAPEIHAWISPWLEANYRPEPRRKHKRNEAFWGDKREPAVPDALPKGGRR